MTISVYVCMFPVIISYIQMIKVRAPKVGGHTFMKEEALDLFQPIKIFLVHSM